MTPRARWSPSSRLSVAVCCCTLLAACGGSVRTGDRGLLPTHDAPPPAQVLTDVAEPSGSESAEPSPSVDARGTLVVRVKDAEGRSRSDVQVAYAGRDARGTLVTGPDGSARVKVPPGAYALEAGSVRCAGELEFTKGQTASADVYAGRTSTVAFAGRIVARRALWAGTPVTWSVEPPWPSGKEVRFTFLLYDRCDDSPAPNRTFTALTYRPSGGLELVRAPHRSDGESTVTMTLRCTRAGTPALNLRDPETGEQVDLLKLRPTFEPGVEFCA